MKLGFVDLVRRVWPGSPSPSEVNEVRLATVAATPATREPDPDASLLAAIVEAASDGLLACDATGRLLLISRAAAALLGVEQISPGQDAEWPAGALALRPAVDRALAGDTTSLELAIDQAGRRLLLEAQASRMIGESGEAEGAVLIIRDVTEVRERAAEADGWLTLAHDLKAPLNSIGGFTTLLLQDAVGPLNPLQRDFLRTIDQEGQRVVQTIEAALQTARAGTAEPQLNRADLHLRPLVGETVERLRSLAIQKSITMEVLVPDELPAVHADRDRIGLVLIHLLDNAIGFSRDGSQIQIAAREMCECVEVSVQDEGLGISPEALGLVFDPLYRGPNQPSEGRVGVGLGLATCKQIIEQHGGRIWAESDPRGGARLAFALPIAYRQAQLEALAAPA